MKNFKLFLFSALCGLGLLGTSCGDGKLHDTDHPDKGKLRIITDWGVGTTATLPYVINYTLEPGGVTNTIEAHSLVELTNLLQPGTYSLEIYSKDGSGGFTRDGDVIQVDDDPDNPGFIHATPSTFFASRTSITVREDKVNILTVPMLPQMRKLVIRVYLANDPLIYSWTSQAGDFRTIDESSIEGTLSGAANRFDFINDTYYGDYKLKLPFKVYRTADNRSRYLETVVTVVGFNDDVNVAKNFSLSFNFAEGIQIPATADEFHDRLFSAGKNFNDFEKKRINDTVSISLVLPLNTSGTAHIENYEPGNGSDGEDIDVGENTYVYSVGDPFPMNSPIKEGIVVWVDDALSLTPGQGSHGVVLSGNQSDLLAWGPTAEILLLEGGVNPAIKDGYRQYTALSNIGVKNNSAITTYINTNKMRGATGFIEKEFEAYAWIKGSESTFSGYWFLPSAKELSLISDAATVNSLLTAAGFPTIDAPIWTSQTEFELKPQNEWLYPTVPEYNLSWVLIRLADGTLGKTHAIYPNPDYDPAWVPDPLFPDIIVNPEPENLPYKNYTRAMRFF